MREETILLKAEFDSRLKAYSFIQSTLALIFCLVTIPLVPFWVLGLGQLLARRQYEALDCALTERSLNFSKGIFVKVQKNVPLDKITDLALHEGPILRALGLTCLKVETAGQSAAQGALLSLVGIRDSLAFRDAVLNQRDRIVTTGTTPAPAPDSGSPDVLADIRDTLGRIEGLMRERSGSGD